MRDTPRWTRNPTWRKIGSLVVVALAAVLLTWAVVAAQNETEVEGEMLGPATANQGDLITYTIEVVNRGDEVPTVALLDEIPAGVTFEACTYRFEGWTTGEPCDAPPELWEWPLPPDVTVDTALVVEVEAGTLVYPIENQAAMMVDGVEVLLDPVTTVVNPLRTYLPLVAQNFGQ